MRNREHSMTPLCLAIGIALAAEALVGTRFVESDTGRLIGRLWIRAPFWLATPVGPAIVP